MDNRYDIAVIGAGMSGSMAARRLSEAGMRVVVIEKARGTGGRLSSKNLRGFEGNGVSVPLGCPGFSAMDRGFSLQLKQWCRDGIVSETAGIDPLVGDSQAGDIYCAQPRSSSLTRHLLEGVDLRLGTRVMAVTPVQEGWILTTKTNENATDKLLVKQVVIATPPAQAAELLVDGHPMKTRLQQVTMLPQWVAIISFQCSRKEVASQLKNMSEHPLIERVFPTSCVQNHDGSVTQYAVIHAARDWSGRNVELTKAGVEKAVISWLQFEQSLISPCLQVQHVHRWLYSQSIESARILAAYLWEPTSSVCGGLGVCGDYFCSSDLNVGGVERAYSSGVALAHQIINDD